MKSILKKINSKLFLLFLCGFFSITAQAQWSEGDDAGDPFSNDPFSNDPFSNDPNLNGPEWEGGVTVNNDYHAPPIDYGDLINPYNYGEDGPVIYGDDYYDDYMDDAVPPVTDNAETDGPNIIDKPVITQAELTKLIQDLIGRYLPTNKNNFVLITADGKSHTGTITRLYDRFSGHSLYYFTPYESSGKLTVGMQYKIPEPTSNGNGGASNINPPILGSIDQSGMPMGYHNIGKDDGFVNVYISENNGPTQDYCERCDKIEYVNNPKYPQLARLIPKIKSFVLNHPLIMKELVDLSGFSEAQIINLLSTEKLTQLVRVANISNFGLYENIVTPNIVFINQHLVSSLETGGYIVYGTPDLHVNLAGTSFHVLTTILHELVHFGRKMNHLSQLVNGIYEAGEVFEENIFGERVTMQGVTNLATRYGWYF